MNKQEISTLVSLTKQLEERLEAYQASTDRLMRCETEAEAEIDRLVEERENIIGEMKPIKEKISALINMQTTQTSDLLRQMYSDGTSAFVAPELQELQQATVSFRSTQAVANEKEQLLVKQFNSRYDDLKDVLMKLREDKKKIDFYSSIRSKELGSALDSRS